MKKSYLQTFVIIIFCISCRESDNVDSINSCVRELIDVGYSVKELAIRTDYEEDILTKAYLKDEDVLSDSCQNKKLQHILELHKEKKIIPVNKTNITAYNGIWEIYTKAQNLPRLSLYTGIGVSKAANALMKRKPLNENDSIRALVAYVNMQYELQDMPPSIDKYYTKTTTLEDLIVPLSFHPNVSDETKQKIEYYIWQNEQFELRANENLRKSIETKVDSKVKNAIDSFITEDVNSYYNMAKCVLKDSLEKIAFYKEKLDNRLNIGQLNKDIQDEIIAYCVSVNCSRAILISEVLNYRDFSNGMTEPQLEMFNTYIASLEEITAILQKKKNNVVVDGSINLTSAGITIWIDLYSKGATVPYSTLIYGALKTVLKTAVFYGTKNLFNYKANEQDSYFLMNKMQKSLKTQLDKQISESLNAKNNYKEVLNKNTKDYYNSVREYFDIKN